MEGVHFNACVPVGLIAQSLHIGVQTIDSNIIYIRNCMYIISMYKHR